MQMPFLRPHMNQIQQLCAEYQVRRLDVFGSALREDFNAKSDIDFLVVFQRNGYGGAFEQFMNFKGALEQLLGRPVDILVDRPFRNSIFQQEVDQTRRSVYAA